MRNLAEKKLDEILDMTNEAIEKEDTSSTEAAYRTCGMLMAYIDMIKSKCECYNRTIRSNEEE